MKIYRFERKQNLPIDIKTAWEFFSSPYNLSKITPPKMDFKIIHPIDAKMYAGQVVTYTIKPLLRIPITWVTEITHVDEPKFFIDEQRFGPYKFWHHQHKFKEIESGTEMTDIVHYAIPFGFFGKIVNFLIVRHKLIEIFNFRNSVINQLFH